ALAFRVRVLQPPAHAWSPRPTQPRLATTPPRTVRPSAGRHRGASAGGSDGAWSPSSSGTPAHRTPTPAGATPCSPGATFPRPPAVAVAALRGGGTDDGDLSRYLAYANATLGRPYQTFYVRPLEGWTGPQPETTGVDPDDPRQAPPHVPERPLVPYRDFSIEY